MKLPGAPEKGIGTPSRRGAPTFPSVSALPRSRRAHGGGSALRLSGRSPPPPRRRFGSRGPSAADEAAGREPDPRRSTGPRARGSTAAAGARHCLSGSWRGGRNPQLLSVSWSESVSPPVSGVFRGRGFYPVLAGHSFTIDLKI